MTKLSVLHISDLHKGNFSDYKHLLSSIENDINECVDKDKIKRPHVIVVSGDLIEGAEGIDSEEQINKQYEDVFLFLEAIVNSILNGDKEKIIIVPGNHDVNREISKTSMKKVDYSIEDVGTLYKKFRNESANIRWNWSDLNFYEIYDIDTYNNRFKNFAYYYNKFYNGKHIFSHDPEYQSSIFTIDEFNVSFIGFNSCYNLDHLNTSGCIHPTCLTSIDRELRNLHESGNLLIGVWHHHTSGFPHENNYLDKRILSAMIDRHINVGLHGHQHISGIANEFKNSLNSESLFLISAGTLYGEMKELPYGAKRQYNIIEISISEDFVDVTIHSREDQNSSLFFIPSWSKGHIGNLDHDFIKFNFKKSRKVTSKKDLIDNILRRYENDLNLNKVCDDLIALGTGDIIVRKFLLDFLIKLKDFNRIYEIFINPKNIEESIALLNAVLEIGDVDKIKIVMNCKTIKDENDKSIVYLKNLAQRLIKK